MMRSEEGDRRRRLKLVEPIQKTKDDVSVLDTQDGAPREFIEIKRTDRHTISAKCESNQPINIRLSTIGTFSTCGATGQR